MNVRHTCPVCKKAVLYNADGKIRRHANPRGKTCRASGRLPVEVGGVSWHKSTRSKKGFWRAYGQGSTDLLGAVRARQDEFVCEIGGRVFARLPTLLIAQAAVESRILKGEEG